MNAYDDKPSFFVGVIQFRDVWQRAGAVDAPVCPEIDEDDFPAQISNAQWAGVEPVADTDKVWGDALSLGKGKLSVVPFLAGITPLRQSQQTSDRQRSRTDFRSNIHGLLLLQAELAVWIELGKPRGDERVVLQVHCCGEDDDRRAKALLQTMRDAGDAPDAGGDELAAISNGQHGCSGTDGVDDEQQRLPFDVRSSCDHSEDRREH